MSGLQGGGGQVLHGSLSAIHQERRRAEPLVPFVKLVGWGKIAAPLSRDPEAPTIDRRHLRFPVPGEYFFLVCPGSGETNPPGWRPGSDAANELARPRWCPGS